MTGPRRAAVPCCSECASDCCGEGSSGTGCPSSYASSVTFAAANVFAAGTYTDTLTRSGCTCSVTGTVGAGTQCCTGTPPCVFCPTCPDCEADCVAGDLPVSQNWEAARTGASSACSLVYTVKITVGGYLGVGGYAVWQWTVTKSGASNCFAVASTNPIVTYDSVTGTGDIWDCVDWENLAVPTWSIT